MIKLETPLSPARIAAGAAVAALAALALVLVAGGLWWAPLALLAGLGLGYLALTRLELIPMVVIFGLFLNLPVVATRFHGLPDLAGMAFFGMLALPLAVRGLLRREPIHYDAVFIGMLVLLAAKAASSLGSRDAGLALEKVLKFAFEGAVIYLLLINVIRSEADLRKVLWALLIAAGISGAVVTYQDLTGTFENTYGGLAQRHAEFRVGSEWRDRSAGPIGDPNYYAQILLIPLPIALTFAVIERRWALRIAALLIAGLIISGIGLTYSRGAAIGLAAVVLLLAMLLRIRPPMIVAGGLVGLLLLSVIAPEFFTRAASLADLRNVVQGQDVEDIAIAGRLGENLAAWNVFIDHPFFGVGPDNFPLFYQEYADEIGMLVHADDRAAHNMYLSIAAEGGLIGLIASLVVMLIPLVQLWAVRRELAGLSPFLSATASALFAAIFGYMLTGVLLTLAYERYFWALLALAGATTLIARLKLRALAGAARQEAAHG
jgi:hypothetical protein